MQQLQELDEYAFKDLREYLSNNKIKSGVYGMDKTDISRNSWLHPRLLYLLQKYALVHVPIPFTSIKVNVSKPAKIKGLSYIVSFGNYTGGELVIDGQDYNIWHRPMVINGSDIKHTVKPFRGKSWSIVFYTNNLTVRKLSDYEPVVVDGKWVLASRIDEVYLDKDNPPLKDGPQTTVPEPVLDDYNSRLTPAQNLMLRFKEVPSQNSPPHNEPPKSHLLKQDWHLARL